MHLFCSKFTLVKPLVIPCALKMYFAIVLNSPLHTTATTGFDRIIYGT